LDVLFRDRFDPMVRLATLLTGSQHDADPRFDDLWLRLTVLSIDQRRCVVLRFYEDMTMREIGDTLSMPVGTVKSHLHRAMRTLRPVLEAERAHEGAER